MQCSGKSSVHMGVIQFNCCAVFIQEMKIFSCHCLELWSISVSCFWSRLQLDKTKKMCFCLLCDLGYCEESLWQFLPMSRVGFKESAINLPWIFVDNVSQNFRFNKQWTIVMTVLELNSTSDFWNNWQKVPRLLQISVQAAEISYATFGTKNRLLPHQTI